MESTSLEENTMIEDEGKQTSKWDLAAEIVQDHTQPGEAGESCQDKETDSVWESSKGAGSDVPKWPGIEADNNTMSKEFSGWSKWENMPGNKDEGKGGDVNRDGEEIMPTTRMDCGDRSWGKSIPLDPDAWRRRSRSPSPKSGWSRSRRTRSRSPSHGFKHETDGWKDRSRSRTGGSTAPCRNFAVGRCRRGSQCRFLHQDVHDHDDRRYGGGSAENRASRQEEGGSPGHASDEAFTDSHEQGKHYDVHGSRYDGHPEKHESQRSTRSSELCNNFLKGRCHRGSACRFVHDSASADGYNEWSSKAGKRERPHDMREPDDSFGRDWRHETRRNSDIPCKYFAGGHCRSGENCKFSHNAPVVDSPEGRSRGDKFSHELVSENRSWDGPKWSERPDARHAHSSPQRRNDNNGAGVSASESRSWDGPKWSDKAPGKNTSNSSQRSKDGVGWGMEESRCNPEDLQSQNPKEDMKHEISPKVVTETILPTCKQNLTQQVSGQQQHVLTGMMQVVASENAHIQQYPGQNGQRQQIPTPSVVQSFNPNTQSQQIGFPPPNMQSLNSNGQNQQIVPPIRNEQNFNPNGLSQQTIPQPLLNKKPDLADANMSPVTSGTPTAPNAAISKQVPQLTNLSASLAQILGNGLYASLNHLSATGVVPSLPYPHPNSANPLAQTAAHVQPNQVSWSQKQYDPICDSIEPVKLDINDRPPGFPLNPHEQTAVEESQASVLTLAPPATGRPNDGDRHRSGGSLEENLHQNRELKSRDPRAKSVGEQQTGQSEKEQKMGQSEKEQHMRQSEKEWQTGQSEKAQQTGESEKEQQTGHSKDMDADCEADEEGKRSKDEKGMRLFKFALVEFVKELLKPAWKEGHLSREAHKTIVKKVVDKVTGAIQPPQIPQTQEKVDLYLSHSKTKLTKLVQAYVSKYSKT
ncbi:zinc finger CCCH domain-containing protein 55-like [Magnolia sinica]|uniref:zinc finger CCCH domain-containing protein 55-like n=1 Tax=Magnolia sinica TaxID=86752 RepID=UPI002657B71C|nr:zinc finger CCCH domain-containing protein 55-like [Magnolia sinica]XP_058089737.1 zinc finger CCCH domain-containing protein 55-like [Magnolia sinica]